MDVEKYKLLLGTTGDPDVTMGLIREYIKQYRPKNLYKFCRFGAHWRCFIIEENIHMNKPDRFNDPFEGECYLNNDEICRRFEFSKYCMQGIIANMSVLANLQSIIQRNTPFAKKLYIDLLRDFADVVRISSFSETNTSMLMWSHYADSHNGFCIEYDTSELSDSLIDHFYPVIYEHRINDQSNMFNFYRQNLYEDDIEIELNRIPFAQYFFKAPDWHYEKEWRLLLNESSSLIHNDLIKFRGSVRAIYLGLRASQSHPEEVAEVLSWARKRRISVFQMVKSNESYKLNSMHIVNPHQI